jgi:V8-like Glu-specific endopeptidase
MKMKTNITGIVSALFFLTSASYALALPKKGSTLADPESAVLNDHFELSSANYDFMGIVKLNNCSGSLVRFEDSLPTDKAMILTNGHCIKVGPLGGFPKPNTYVLNYQVTRSFQFLRSDGTLSGQSVNSTKVLYGTMTGTDLALYELERTFGDIEKTWGYVPLTMSKSKPDAGQDIEILSGYWRRGYSCSIDMFIHQLREDDYSFTDSIRYTEPGCDTIGGTSGSPIIASGSRTVIGVNNTGNEDGERCTMNNPCEVSENGEVFFEKGLSYGQQTYLIYGCLDSNRKFDLSLETCKLFKN